MTTEDYVSYEVAKLLKEKGFNGFCACCYEPKDGIFKTIFEDTSGEVGLHDWNNLTQEKYNRIGLGSWFGFISAPSLAMALKWLREEKRTSIIIEFDVTKRGYCPYVYQLDYDMDWVVKWRINTPMKYEKAIETALKYSLENLI